jgi:mono/diheme cytochrome c family protein
MATRPRRRRWATPAAEAALVLVALLLAFAAAAAGFVVGRETADDDEPAAAETTTSEATTTAETQTETETEPATTTAETQTGTEGGEDVDAAAVFADAGCGGCHEFGPANSTGTVGPSLDNIDLSKEEIAQQVRNGGGGMPAFGDRLSDEEIDAVADYVEGS